MWRGQPRGQPRAAHLVVLQHLGGSVLVRDGQPDVGEGGGVVAQPQAHLHFHGLADRPCHRERGFTCESGSAAHRLGQRVPRGQLGWVGHPGVALTEGRVGHPGAVQLVSAVGAVVPAVTHRLQRLALAIPTGELCGAAGLWKVRGQGMAGSQPAPLLTTPVCSLWSLARGFGRSGSGRSQIPWVIWGQPSGHGSCLCADEPFQVTPPWLWGYRVNQVRRDPRGLWPNLFLQAGSAVEQELFHPGFYLAWPCSPPRMVVAQPPGQLVPPLGYLLSVALRAW